MSAERDVRRAVPALGPIPVALVAVASFTASVVAIVDTAWSGIAAFIVLIAVHIGFGFAVGRWWALLVTPIVWLLVILTSPHSASSDLSGTDVEAVTIVVFALVGGALVAAGIGIRRLLGRSA